MPISGFLVLTDRELPSLRFRYGRETLVGMNTSCPNDHGYGSGPLMEQDY